MKGKKFVWPSLLALLIAMAIMPALRADDKSAKPEQEQKIAANEHARPYLGVGVAPADAALLSQLADVIGRNRGVVIQHVMDGSPAEEAGLQVHDVLITFQQQDLYSPEQLVKLVRNAEPGQEVVLGYVRGGKAQETVVRLSKSLLNEQRPISRSSYRLPLEDDLGWVFQGRTEAEERERQNDPEPWATFHSMSITKLDEQQYKAEIQFRKANGETFHREYVGSREEIRQAVEQDKELPKQQRDHLLRSLDQQSPSLLQLLPGKSWRGVFEMDGKWFNWQDLDF